MFQGGSEAEELNFGQFRFNPMEIDVLILTHAHIDHSGRIPQLVKRGFKGKIITAAPTFELCRIMLPDSAFIQESEAEWQNKKRKRAGKAQMEPLYTVKDAEEALKLFQPVEYNKMIALDSRINVRFRDAGHILGSGIIELWVNDNGEEIKLVFSGDLGNRDVPIMHDPTVIEEADYVIMESTYGDRLHNDTQNKELALLDIIIETIERNGNVVIPSFAIERTQEILYVLNMLKEAKDSRLKSVPVYVDSPLAINATKIFQSFLPYMDEETQSYIKSGDNPFEFPNLIFTQTADESRTINFLQGSSIIISASGMCEAGRIKHHLKHNLWREESSIVFVGYQAQNTLGRRIKDGEKTVKIFGEEIGVKAHIYSIEGFSGHADQRGLLDWIGSFKKKPKKVFLVHGEENALSELSRLISANYSIPNEIAQLGQSVELASGTQTKVVMERPSLQKVGIKATVVDIRRKVNDTLDNLLLNLQENDNIKTDKLYYDLEKLQAALDEINREIN
jgi:metallo-beta-lactamase family protein